MKDEKKRFEKTALFFLEESDVVQAREDAIDTDETNWDSLLAYEVSSADGNRHLEETIPGSILHLGRYDESLGKLAIDIDTTLASTIGKGETEHKRHAILGRQRHVLLECQVVLEPVALLARTEGVAIEGTTATRLAGLHIMLQLIGLSTDVDGIERKLSQDGCLLFAQIERVLEPSRLVLLIPIDGIFAVSSCKEWLELEVCPLGTWRRGIDGEDHMNWIFLLDARWHLVALRDEHWSQGKALLWQARGI